MSKASAAHSLLFVCNHSCVTDSQQTTALPSNIHLCQLVAIVHLIGITIWYLHRKTSACSHHSTGNILSSLSEGILYVQYAPST